MFTYQYQQPDEYHFSMDSIHLAEFVAEHLSERTGLESLRVLDLCAGCGVIGIELSWYLKTIRNLDFIEVQEIYADYFNQNAALVNRPELRLQWFQLNYEVLMEESWKEKYDLIVSNPPYFLSGHGMLSPSSFKNRCRFYLDSTFQNYILALANTLAIDGEAYFLLRPLKQHGHDLFSDIQSLLKERNILVEKIFNIRSTDVVMMKKLGKD